MNYAAIEDAIVARLIAKIGDSASVVALPETQAANIRPTTKARVTVAYLGSNFDGGRYGNNVNVMAMDSVIQEETIKLTVEIEAKVLRGAGGIYELLVSVRQALIGFEPLGMDKMLLLESKFQEFKENQWVFQLTFSTTGQVIQDWTVDTDPLITNINFDQNFQS